MGPLSCKLPFCTSQPLRLAPLRHIDCAARGSGVPRHPLGTLRDTDDKSGITYQPGDAVWVGSGAAEPRDVPEHSVEIRGYGGTGGNRPARTARVQSERRSRDPRILARPERLELPTPRFVVWCSIQLSYGRRGGGHLPQPPTSQATPGPLAHGRITQFPPPPSIPRPCPARAHRLAHHPRAHPRRARLHDVGRAQSHWPAHAPRPAPPAAASASRSKAVAQQHRQAQHLRQRVGHAAGPAMSGALPWIGS